MRNLWLFSLTLFSLLVSSCSTSTPPPPTPQVVSVYSTSAAEPWLSELYDCADSTVSIIRVDDANAAEIALQIGEPEFFAGFEYQIDEEEIWVVTHRESPIPNMSLEDLRALFMGQGDPSIQVWVFSSDDDVQRIFNQTMMQGRILSSSAYLATSAQHMLDVLESERQAVGILPVTWSMKMNGSRGMYLVATVPVLALTKSEPQGVIKELISCLQK